MRYGALLLVLILTASVVLGYAFLSHAQAPRIVEYKVIVGQYIGLPAIQGGLQSTLTEQGQAGWDLIQALPMSGTFSTNMVLVFKR